MAYDLPWLIYCPDRLCQGYKPIRESIMNCLKSLFIIPVMFLFVSSAQATLHAIPPPEHFIEATLKAVPLVGGETAEDLCDDAWQFYGIRICQVMDLSHYTCEKGHNKYQSICNYTCLTVENRAAKAAWNLYCLQYIKKVQSSKRQCPAGPCAPPGDG